MVINKFNLSIADLCTLLPLQGNASDVLHVTEAGTLAVNGPYSVSVSAVQKEDSDVTGVVTKECARTLSNRIHPTDVQPINGLFPLNPKYQIEKPVLFETCITPRFLLLLAQHFADFEGKAVRLRFTGPNDPIQLESRNPTTHQRMEALLMPRLPGIDKESFADPAPKCADGCQYSKDVDMWPEHRCSGECQRELSDFEKALQMAAALGGGK